MQWIVIATGHSLKAEDVDYVRGKGKVVAVSDAYKLAPWADCLVSHDRAWWRQNLDAFDFPGEKCCRNILAQTTHFLPPDMPTACNSGLMGMYYAKEQGATRIILLGFDMQGDHYFGKHAKLKNTDERGFQMHLKQFTQWSGCPVINCTPNSRLNHFPKAALRDII